MIVPPTNTWTGSGADAGSPSWAGRLRALSRSRFETGIETTNVSDPWAADRRYETLRLFRAANSTLIFGWKISGRRKLISTVPSSGFAVRG